MTGSSEFRDLVVFCRQGKGGNPLAFVDADSVSEDERPSVTTAIGYSETVFAEMASHRVHIFTPGGRIPFAGHPLVGSAYAFGPNVDRVTYDTGTAETRHEGSLVSVTVELAATVEPLPKPPFAQRAWEVSIPQAYQLVQVESAQSVAELSPADLGAAFSHTYIWAWSGDSTVRARFFAPGLGVLEDPATGSAAAALTAVLEAATGSIIVHQGEEMGAPSLIEVSWNGTSVTLGGEVQDRGLQPLPL